MIVLGVLTASITGQVVIGHHQRLLTALLFLVALGSWMLLVRSARRDEIQALWVKSSQKSRSATWLLVAMVGLIIAMVAIPPATSTDFNSYALYGRMVSEYSLSPYLHSPRDIAGDLWYPRVSYFWSDAPSVYGPVFTALSAFVMMLAGDSVTGARIGFGAIAGVALLVTVALVARKLGWTKAIVLVGLNPLLLTFGVNDVHCDVLAGAFVVAGAIALVDKRVVVGALCLAGATLVKVSLLPALAGGVLWLWFKVSRKAAVVASAVAAVFGAVAVLSSGGAAAVEPLLSATGRHTRFSVWNPVHEALTAWLGDGIPGTTPADAIVGALAALSVVALTLALWWRWRREAEPYLLIGSGLVAYQLLGAYMLSWYSAWSVPVLALVAKRRLFLVAMAHGAWVAIAYLSGWLGLVVALVAAFFVMSRRRLAT